MNSVLSELTCDYIILKTNSEDKMWSLVCFVYLASRQAIQIHLLTTFVFAEPCASACCADLLILPQRNLSCRLSDPKGRLLPASFSWWHTLRVGYVFLAKLNVGSGYPSPNIMRSAALSAERRDLQMWTPSKCEERAAVCVHIGSLVCCVSFVRLGCEHYLGALILC